MNEKEALELRDKLIGAKEISSKECKKAIALLWENGYTQYATEIRLMLEKEVQCQDHIT